jgi:hypothetical protein
MLDSGGSSAAAAVAGAELPLATARLKATFGWFCASAQ